MLNETPERDNTDSPGWKRCLFKVMVGRFTPGNADKFWRHVYNRGEITVK